MELRMGSFNLSSLPCMENLFEDTSVDVSVEVGDAAEVAEETTEATEVATDVQEDTAEASDTETTTELIFQHIDTLINRKMYLETYGYDRRFAMLASQDGVDYIQGGAPAVESVNDVSSVNDSYTIAALEGVGEALKSAWEWIKKVLGKIANWVGRFFRSVVMMFSSLENNIMRLKKLLSNSTWDTERAEKASGDVPESRKDVEGAMNKAIADNANNNGGGIAANSWTGISKDLTTHFATIGKYALNDMGDQHDVTDTNTMHDIGSTNVMLNNKDNLKKFRDATRKIGEDLKKVADKKTSISNVKSGSVSDWLSLATEICNSKTSLKNLGDAAAKNVGTAKKQAEKLSMLKSNNGSVSSAVSKKFRAITNVLSNLQSFSAKFCGSLVKIANWLVKGAAKVLGACYKKNK